VFLFRAHKTGGARYKIGYLILLNKAVCPSLFLSDKVGPNRQAFKRHFLEMAGVTFAVAAVSFLIGYAMRAFLGVDV
jgi:hypothetical protein